MTKEERLAADFVDGGKYLLFYGAKNSHGEYSNFSPHSVILPHPFYASPTIYLSGEHRYQAMKAKDAEAHEYVRHASTPFKSKQRGREIELRDGWGESYGDLCYLVMLETVLGKFSQHSELRSKLVKHTNEGLVLYEDSPTDDIWGWRYREDYRGKNLLGRALMSAGNLLAGYRL